jgi:hypothetical protein
MKKRSRKSAQDGGADQDGVCDKSSSSDSTITNLITLPYHLLEMRFLHFRTALLMASRSIDARAKGTQNFL